MQKINPEWDRRPVIVHAQLICDEDLPRFAQLGVIANIQPLWCYLDPMNKELIAPRIGVERNNQQYRLRSLINAGAMIAYGSDWPITSQIPMLAIDVPVTRTNPLLGITQPWNLEEAITKEESLRFYTHNVAYQMFRENERGTLEAGKTADFLVLRNNEIEAIYVNGYISKVSE
jgi:predicted amidohydrolase YtcJ